MKKALILAVLLVCSLPLASDAQMLQGIVGASHAISAGMSILQSPSTTTSSSGTGTVAVTTASTTAGSMLIFWSGGVSYTGVIGNVGAAWTSITSLTGTAAFYLSQYTTIAGSVYYLCNAPAGITTVTGSGANINYEGESVTVIEVAGASATGCLENSAATLASASGTMTSTSIAISGNTTLIGLAGATNVSSIAVGSGYTQASKNLNASGVDWVAEYKLNTTSTPQTATVTSSTGGGVAILAVH